LSDRRKIIRSNHFAENNDLVTIFLIVGF